MLFFTLESTSHWYKDRHVFIFVFQGPPEFGFLDSEVAIHLIKGKSVFPLMSLLVPEIIAGRAPENFLLPLRWTVAKIYGT
jgi:hypothetical protein